MEEKKANRINFEYVVEKIGTGVLMYFEIHKELLNDPDFDCAYKIAKDAYIKRCFHDKSIDLIEKFYLFDVESILRSNPVEVIDAYEPEAYQLVDIVKRYDIASRYDDILKYYN